MMEIFDVSYNLLSDSRSSELFSLRKKVFKDRLNWIVNCENGMEYDEYDNNHTTYLFGVHDNQVICSLRFIEIKYPNMITGVFKSYFNNIELPNGNYVEASRLFIDKDRAKKLQLQHYPLSSMLFLSMINYTRHQGYEGIYAIISHPMLTIFKRSGWLISVVEQGMSEKNQRIYLVYMPVDDHNQQILIHKINKALPTGNDTLNNWPLSLKVRNNGSDQLQLNGKTYSMLGVSHT
ncbi:acyl-homoserine-lactone synthase [Yersinia pekkanenii]|uniref:Acyl-homoserine-lactone synthase n=1 Tax=Yersinia pekkanenii TaxID=1288385 RepID=A0A0T9PN28_9GAMM|nr:acyl-homoserine-lactone synthase [Yersinia pekkanenii]CNH73376.1 N-acylhomoserine lactone synthase YspI [Yersinia pekkanenii]CRY68045.1 N-acylhomoserine lactone synthase YspI [Yersinia pekkanenii]